MIPDRDFLAASQRLVWHEGLGELAQALLRARGGTERRLHVFDIPPRLVRGLFAASFADGNVIHRCLAPYYEKSALDRERDSLEAAVRWMGVRVVDGRVEIGAGTGEVLSYFLANDDDATDEDRAEMWRRESYHQWLDAAKELGPTARVRVAPVTEAGTVVAASGRGVHYLIRLDGQGCRNPKDAVRRLRRAQADELREDSALYRDIMGEWVR